MLDKLSSRILIGDAATLSKTVGTVHCVVTSPPYYQKRTYGENILELGREESVDIYVQNLVNVFESISLHPRGSCWVNLSDTREKGSLLMVPERFALAMLQKGWKLVDTVIWAKVVDRLDGTSEGTCMIEPAIRRLNGNGYEYFYRFVKDTNAWTDMCAVSLKRQEAEGGSGVRYLPEDLMDAAGFIEGRRLHNVWSIPKGQTRDKHYAVFPTALCERPIAMTCPMWVNPDGTFRTRIIESQVYDEGRGSARIFGKYSTFQEEDREKSGRQDTARSYIPKKPVTVGWTPLIEGWSPGVVLDPFCGSGTTGHVALLLGRSFVGLELYEEYARIAENRCATTLQVLQDKNISPFDICK